MWLMVVWFAFLRTHSECRVCLPDSRIFHSCLIFCLAVMQDSMILSFFLLVRILWPFRHPVSLIPHAFTEATISLFAFFSKKRLVDFVLHILQHIDTLLTVISFCKPVISCAICYISRQKANHVSFDIYMYICIYVHIMYLLKFYEEHLHKLQATYSWSVIKICY